jgi:hypothetical protein
MCKQGKVEHVASQLGWRDRHCLGPKEGRRGKAKGDTVARDCEEGGGTKAEST